MAIIIKLDNYRETIESIMHEEEHFITLEIKNENISDFTSFSFCTKHGFEGVACIPPERHKDDFFGSSQIIKLFKFNGNDFTVDSDNMIFTLDALKKFVEMYPQYKYTFPTDYVYLIDGEKKYCVGYSMEEFVLKPVRDYTNPSVLLMYAIFYTELFIRLIKNNIFYLDPNSSNLAISINRPVLIDYTPYQIKVSSDKDKSSDYAERCIYEFLKFCRGFLGNLEDATLLLDCNSLEDFLQNLIQYGERIPEFRGRYSEYRKNFPYLQLDQ